MTQNAISNGANEFADAFVGDEIVPAQQSVVQQLTTESPIHEEQQTVVDPIVIFEGQTMAMPTADFGSTPGQVRLRVGGIALNARLLEWNEENLSFQVPSLQLVQPIDGSLSIVLHTGEETDSVPVTLMPSASAPETMAEVTVGSEFNLDGVDFGPTTGQVQLQLSDKITLPVAVIDWSAQRTRIAIPDLNLAEPAVAEMTVYNGSEELIDRMPIRLLTQ